MDINKDTTDEDKNNEDVVILDKLTLAEHHLVFKFTLFENGLRKSTFIAASENLSKLTSSKVTSMVMSSINVKFIWITIFCCYN